MLAFSPDHILALGKANRYNIIIDMNISHIAKLANLPLSKEKEAKLEAQLKETLDYVKRLDEVNTENIKPTSQVTGLENITREDIILPSLSQEEALKNAKATYNGFFVVKAILQNE